MSAKTIPHMLQSKGYTEFLFNNLTKDQMIDLYNGYKGIDPADSNPNKYILSELPGAVAETVGGYKEKITTAATAAGRTMRNTALIGLAGLGLTVLIVYREPIRKALGGNK